jgi:hypothetical protein
VHLAVHEELRGRAARQPRRQVHHVGVGHRYQLLDGSSVNGRRAGSRRWTP